MNGGTWGGEAGSEGYVNYEVTYALSPPQTEQVTFKVEKYYTGLHAANDLAQAWNSKPGRPVAIVEPVTVPGNPPQGRVWGIQHVWVGVRAAVDGPTDAFARMIRGEQGLGHQVGPGAYIRRTPPGRLRPRVHAG